MQAYLDSASLHILLFPMIGVAIVSIIVGEGGNGWLGALVLGSQLRQLAPSVPRLLWLHNVSAPVQTLLRPLCGRSNGRLGGVALLAGDALPMAGATTHIALVWRAGRRGRKPRVVGAHEQSVLMKFQLWGLTRYRALLFLDVDVVLHASPVPLLALALAPPVSAQETPWHLAAAHPAAHRWRECEGLQRLRPKAAPRGQLCPGGGAEDEEEGEAPNPNGGVWLVRPNNDTQRRLLEAVRVAQVCPQLVEQTIAAQALC